MSHWKKMDSPNVTDYSYAYGDGHGNIVEHPEGSMFEGAPHDIPQNNELRFYNNTHWAVKNKGAWYTLDSYNDSYDVSGSY